MPLSPYVARMRAHVGTDLLLLPSVSAVVRDDAGRVLLVRRSDNGRWSVPAGVIEPGEQPAEAAVREVLEETGVHIRVDGVAGVAAHPVTYPNGDRCGFMNVWFSCRAVGGEARVNDDESVQVGWFAADGLPDLDDWALLRIGESGDDAAPTWYVEPGGRHPALNQPDAI